MPKVDAAPGSTARGVGEGGGGDGRDNKRTVEVDGTDAGDRDGLTDGEPVRKRRGDGHDACVPKRADNGRSAVVGELEGVRDEGSGDDESLNVRSAAVLHRDAAASLAEGHIILRAENAFLNDHGARERIIVLHGQPARAEFGEPAGVRGVLHGRGNHHRTGSKAWELLDADAGIAVQLDACWRAGCPWRP